MTRPTERRLKIAVIGGTGDLGRGLAMRWARAGHDITIGSRDGARAAEVANRLNALADTTTIGGMANTDAAGAAELVALTVPYASHGAMLDDIAPHLQGKILIDVTVPLVPPKVRTVILPPEGSAAKAAQERLGDGVKVVSAFQNIAAAHLSDLDHAIDCDVLVCGNDKAARELVIALASDAGMKGWHAGRIANSAVAEAMTSALIFINGHYKINGAGVRITGSVGEAETAD